MLCSLCSIPLSARFLHCIVTIVKVLVICHQSTAPQDYLLSKLTHCVTVCILVQDGQRNTRNQRLIVASSNRPSALILPLPPPPWQVPPLPSVLILYRPRSSPWTLLLNIKLHLQSLKDLSFSHLCRHRVAYRRYRLQEHQ
jgi:hypothetical protein